MIAPLLAVLGGALLTGALNAAGLRVGATPGELVLWGALGVLFARGFALGAMVVTLPVLLGGIELVTGTGGAAVPALAGDPLTIALPGTLRLELVPLVFAGVYGAWAHRFEMRWRATWTGIATVLAVSVALDGDIPTLTLLGAALLLPSADRLARVARST